MIWECEFLCMNKGSITQFLQGKTVHRAPKLVALAVSCSVLVTMVALDASASPNAHAYANAKAEAAHTVLLDWRSVATQLLETEFGKRGVRPIVGHPTTTPVRRAADLGRAAGRAHIRQPLHLRRRHPRQHPHDRPPGGRACDDRPSGGRAGVDHASDDDSTTVPPTTTTTAPPTTTTTAPSTPSASGGLITAGASRSECLVASNRATRWRTFRLRSTNSRMRRRARSPASASTPTVPSHGLTGPTRGLPVRSGAAYQSWVDSGAPEPSTRRRGRSRSDQPSERQQPAELGNGVCRRGLQHLCQRTWNEPRQGWLGELSHSPGFGGERYVGR